VRGPTENTNKGTSTGQGAEKARQPGWGDKVEEEPRTESAHLMKRNSFRGVPSLVMGEEAEKRMSHGKIWENTKIDYREHF